MSSNVKICKFPRLFQIIIIFINYNVNTFVMINDFNLPTCWLFNWSLLNKNYDNFLSNNVLEATVTLYVLVIITQNARRTFFERVALIQSVEKIIKSSQ